MTLRRTLEVFIAVAALIAPAGNAGQIDSATLLINGATLEVPASVDTGADIPAVIQTTFAKKMNEDGSGVPNALVQLTANQSVQFDTTKVPAGLCRSWRPISASRRKLPASSST